MPKHTDTNRLGSAGFTLIELMVTLLIAAIIIAIAGPSYLQQVRQSRRTEAKTALLDLAGREERYYNTANPPAYSSLPSDLGYGAVAATFPMTVGSGYYQVNVVVTAAAGAVPATYTITAVPITADQLKDTQCLLFTLTNTGVQTSSSPTNVCWQ